MTKTVLNVGLPVKTFYIQGLIAPENSTLIRYPMKKFLFNTLFAAMVAWQLSSIAATPEFIIESERKAFQDVKLGGAGNVWSAEGRWTNGVPGQGENILYRTGLGYKSKNAQSGYDTDLVVDMDRYIYVDEVSTNAPIRVSYFSFNNHWNIPTTLSSIDGKTLEIFACADSLEFYIRMAVAVRDTEIIIVNIDAKSFDAEELAFITENLSCNKGEIKINYIS